jgi:hypothetical protein
MVLMKFFCGKYLKKLCCSAKCHVLQNSNVNEQKQKNKNKNLFNKLKADKLENIQNLTKNI